MSQSTMCVDELIVLVGSCVADGETWVVPDQEFVGLLFNKHPECSGSVIKQGSAEIDGYISFTNLVCEGNLGFRLEELQKVINDRWACWDAESGGYDPTQCHGITDSYAFVNASSLIPEMFTKRVFVAEVPRDYVERTAVKAVAASPERKPWLL